jgi:hypothetical protein
MSGEQLLGATAAGLAIGSVWAFLTLGRRANARWFGNGVFYPLTPASLQELAAHKYPDRRHDCVQSWEGLCFSLRSKGVDTVSKLSAILAECEAAVVEREQYGHRTLPYFTRLGMINMCLYERSKKPAART